jgi:hypothetical protein
MKGFGMRFWSACWYFVVGTLEVPQPQRLTRQLPLAV